MSIFNILRKRKELNASWSKYYKETDLNITIPDISMYDEVKNSALKYPNNWAYEYFSKKVTYKKFLNEIDDIAISFYNLGIRKGDIVTICLPNIPEVLHALYALNKIGAIASMLHPLSSEREIKENILTTKSKVLVIMDTIYNKIKQNKRTLNLKNIIYVSVSNSMTLDAKLLYNLVKPKKYERFPKNDIFISWKDFAKIKKNTEHDEINNLKFGKDTPAVIIESGGTSGNPKKVVIQNRAFILAAKQESIALKNLKPGDSCLAIMPNFHGFGLSVLMHTPLSLGCYTILVPKFNAKKFDTLFKKTKPTCVLGVPTLFDALTKCHNESNLDLSYLKYIISGGDILNENLEQKINDYLKDHNASVKITQGYGLSEALAAVALGSDDKNKSGSVGIPLPGNHIKIIDMSTRKELPKMQVGEICLHTKALMMGYLNNEQETNKVLQIHDDGHIWLHTGDLGYMDNDGFIFYKGRIKRMIISNGYNIYPSYIEKVLALHPQVLQATVVGTPHKYKGEVPKAFVVLKDNYNSFFIKNELASYCSKNLASYMIPEEFIIRKSLPKTKLGKVDFKSLK